MDPSKPDTTTDVYEHGPAKEIDDRNHEEARKTEQEAKDRVDGLVKSIIDEQWMLVKIKYDAFLLKNPPAGMNLPGCKKRPFVSDRNFWGIEEVFQYQDDAYEAIRTARDKLEGLDRQIMDEGIRILEECRAKDRESRQRGRVEGGFSRRGRIPEGECSTQEEWDAHWAEKRGILAEKRAEADEQERQRRVDILRNYKERVKALEKEEREGEKREAAQLVQRMKGLDLHTAPACSSSPAKPDELKDPDDTNSTGREESQSKPPDERQRHSWEARAREEAMGSNARSRSSRQDSPTDTADMADSDYVRVDMLDLDQSEEFEEDDDEMYRAN